MSELTPDLAAFKGEEKESMLGDFTDVKKTIKRKFLTHYPITIRLQKLPEDCGSCHLKNNRLYVLVNKRLSEEAQIFSLIHEFAHAVAWRCSEQECERESSHDAEFGIAYAQIWRAVFEN